MNERRRGWGTGAALVSALLAGCYRGATPPQLCEGDACGLTTGAGSSSGSSTAAPTTTLEPGTGTTAEPTTGAPIDDSITFRLDSFAFIDPHLFYSTPDQTICINDITEFVNVALTDDAMSGSFNLLVRFEDFADVDEMRLVDADCEDLVVPGERRKCSPNPNTQAVLLSTMKLDAGACSEIDLSHFQPINAPFIHAPEPPCVRSNQVDFSVPISDSVASLNLRDAQFTARVDDLLDPQRLDDGLLYGFLSKAVAENLNFSSDMLGVIDLWSMIDSPACLASYPDYLPSVDEFEVNNMPVPGVWIAINFTAERVDYVVP